MEPSRRACMWHTYALLCHFWHERIRNGGLYAFNDNAERS